MANAPGLIISIWLNMAAAKLQYCTEQPQRVDHYMSNVYLSLSLLERERVISSAGAVFSVRVHNTSVQDQ